jgi:hypothetical protein
VGCFVRSVTAPAWEPVCVTVVPVSSPLRDAVLSLAPAPEQEPWSGAAVQALPDAEADPRRHPFVILDEHGEAAGFFVLDETPSPADPSAEPSAARVLRRPGPTSGRVSAGGTWRRSPSWSPANCPARGRWC